MKQIKLTNNRFALVDDADFEYLNQFKWNYSNGYANTMENKKVVSMHRMVNKTPDGFDTDHIDRNRLNNQKSNLRTATGSINQINVSLRKDNASGYKGVCWHKKYKKWQASVHVNRKYIFLGQFQDIRAAWLARKWGERIYYGTCIK